MATVREALALALDHHQSGRSAEAETLYRRILHADPGHPHATYYLGILCAQSGRLPEAAERLEQAVALCGDVVERRINLAGTLRALGRIDDALVQYRAALALDPAQAGLQADYGATACAAQGGDAARRFASAEAALSNAVALNPATARVYALLGQLREKRGNDDAAARDYRRAGLAAPDFAEAWQAAGRLECVAGRFSAAAAAARRALRAQPDFQEAWRDLGVALAGVSAVAVSAVAVSAAGGDDMAGGENGAGGEAGAALRAFRIASALRPDDADCCVHLGRALTGGGLTGGGLNGGRLNENGAEAAFRRAATIDPLNAPALSSLTTLRRRAQRWAAMTPVARRGVIGAPQSALALSNLAVAQQDAGGRDDAALLWLRRAAAADPQDAETRKMLGLALLRRGDMAEGFAEYAWRRRSPDFSEPRRTFPYPEWRGEDPTGKRLLLWGEQGVGDEVIYAGMVADLAAAGVDCAVECDPRLVPLFRRSFNGVETTARNPARTPPVLSRPADFHCSLGDVGRWVRPAAADFPARSAYLTADPALTERLRARYVARCPGRRLIGLAWRSKNAEYGRNKSLSLPELAPILTRPDLAFVNLQYGDCREELAAVRRDLGVEIFDDPEIDQLRDIDAFAAQTAAMDAAATTSNTTAHVAGALGVPGVVLLPCGRGCVWYWFDGRDDSPWYPSLRLVRQTAPGEWAGVVARAAQVLPTLLSPAPERPQIKPPESAA